MCVHAEGDVGGEVLHHKIRHVVAEGRFSAEPFDDCRDGLEELVDFSGLLRGTGESAEGGWGAD